MPASRRRTPSRFGTPEVIYQPVQENFRHLFDAFDDPIRQAHARELGTGASGRLLPGTQISSPASGTALCANATGICIWGT